MTDSRVILKVLTEERLANCEVLKHFIQSGEEVTGGHEDERFEDADLDRGKANEQDAANLAEMSASDNLYLKSALLARMNEEHRIRRDVRIINAGHRELMLSALRILDMRNGNLRMLISDENARISAGALT